MQHSLIFPLLRLTAIPVAYVRPQCLLLGCNAQGGVFRWLTVTFPPASLITHLTTKHSVNWTEHLINCKSEHTRWAAVKVAAMRSDLPPRTHAGGQVLTTQLAGVKRRRSSPGHDNTHRTFASSGQQGQVAPSRCVPATQAEVPASSMTSGGRIPQVPQTQYASGLPHGLEQIARYNTVSTWGSHPSQY